MDEIPVDLCPMDPLNQDLFPYEYFQTALQREDDGVETPEELQARVRRMQGGGLF